MGFEPTTLRDLVGCSTTELQYWGLYALHTAGTQEI